jgi:hypothetical protein
MCSALIALLTCILAANVGFYKFRLKDLIYTSSSTYGYVGAIFSGTLSRL